MIAIIDLRHSVDAVLNSTKKLVSSRQVALVITNLELAFSWLGEALKASGSTSPYTESENHKSDVIEPVADHDAKRLVDGFLEVEEIQTARVKFLRAAIERDLGHFKDARVSDYTTTKEYVDSLDYFWKHYKEAKFWLGWELGRIKSMEEALK